MCSNENQTALFVKEAFCKEKNKDRHLSDHGQTGSEKTSEAVTHVLLIQFNITEPSLSL